MRKDYRAVPLLVYGYATAAVIGAVVGLVLLSSPARSQISCYPAEAVEKTLKDEYGETKTWEGLDRNSRKVRIYSNPTTKTWTLVIMQDDVLACPVVTGTDAS
jgi:hypothetical protein